MAQPTAPGKSSVAPASHPPDEPSLKVDASIASQPRSGERVQPTAQAEGKKVIYELAPKGRKTGYATDGTATEQLHRNGQPLSPHDSQGPPLPSSCTPEFFSRNHSPSSSKVSCRKLRAICAELQRRPLWAGFLPDVHSVAVASYSIGSSTSMSASSAEHKKPRRVGCVQTTKFPNQRSVKKSPAIPKVNDLRPVRTDSFACSRSHPSLVIPFCLSQGFEYDEAVNSLDR